MVKSKDNETTLFEEIIVKEGFFDNIKKHMTTYKKDRDTPVLSHEDAFHQSLDEIPAKHLDHYTNYLRSNEGKEHASYVAKGLPDNPSPKDYRDSFRRLAREYKQKHSIKEEENMTEATTAAAATLAPNSMTKAGMMAATMSAMNGMSKSAMIDFFNQVMAQFGPNVFPGADVTNTAAQNQASIKAKISVKEDVAEMFDGEEITEEFKTKVETIFEAAVNAKLELEVARLAEETEKEFTSLVEEYKEEISDKVDEYLSYAVEQWVEENKLAIENGLKLEIFEKFFSGLKNLFIENNVSIPDEQVSMVGELEQKIAALETRVNEEVEKNISQKSIIEELTKQQLVTKISEGLSESQKEKFASLSEGIEFENLNEFESKLNIIKSTYFKPSSSKVIKEEEEVIGVDDLNESEKSKQTIAGPMAVYSQAISRTVKKL